MTKINVTRSSMPPLEEYLEEIKAIWDNYWLTNSGPKHEAFVAALKEKLNVKEVNLFVNGHIALEAAFSIFPKGSEVITTPFTYGSTTLAIIRAGLIPVFCDIESQYFTIDAAKIEQLINEKTVAIAPVHVYGNICDYKTIDVIAKKHNLQVIYDAAHAFGEKIDNIDVACLGNISMFSFHATKVFHTIEGGCLVCHDRNLSEYFTAWSKFGMYDGVNCSLEGINGKMNEFQSSMGLCNLRHFDEQILLRKRASQCYRERLECIDGLYIPPVQNNVTANYAYFPVQVIAEQYGINRDELVELLAKNEIGARKYFYPLTSEFPIIQDKYSVNNTPIAKKVSTEILCLPLYAGLSTDDINYICDVIEAAAIK